MNYGSSAPEGTPHKVGPLLTASLQITSLCILIGRNSVIARQEHPPHLQGEVVEAHGPQGEGPGQETHVREQDSDGVLEGGEFLQDRRRLDELPVRLRLLDLEETAEDRFRDDRT